MISPANSSISAINAALTQQAVSAHNIANSNTNGYKRAVATTEEDAHGGVNVSIGKDPDQGPTYVRPDGIEVVTSNVDQAREAVDQIRARTMLAANVESLRTYEETLKSTIDIVA